MPQIEHNEPRWADISVADVDQAKTFYTELFGWSYQDRYSEGLRVYSMAFRKSDEEQLHAVAGIAPHWGGKSENNASAWHAHVLVENVDQSVERVLDAGGLLTVPQMDVMNAGRMAICQDSLCNSMILWQSYNNYGPNLMRVPESIAWFELITDNPGEAIQFYEAVHGWSAHRTPKEGVEYWMFKLNDKPIAGMQTDASPTNGKNHWLVYFCVSDLSATLDKCLQLGGSVIFGPVNEPSIGDYGVATDNQNMHFGLVQFNS